MERREFAKGTAVALLAALTEASSELGLGTAGAESAPKSVGSAREIFQLTKKNDPEVVKSVYEGTAGVLLLRMSLTCMPTMMRVKRNSRIHWRLLQR